MTNGFSGYHGIGKGFKSHETVDHGTGEFVSGDVYTNTANRGSRS